MTAAPAAVPAEATAPEAVLVAVAEKSVANAVRKLIVLGPKTRETSRKRSKLNSVTSVIAATVTLAEATRAAAAMRAGTDLLRSIWGTCAGDLLSIDMPSPGIGLRTGV